MAPQEQAERLLERAINHYAGAPEEIARLVDGWRGRIHSTERLENLTNTAYFGSDLRVRAMALEIWLARDEVAKTPESVEQLISKAAAGSGKKWFPLSTLGILGNRGVETARVFQTLNLYMHDPDSSVRAAAINGMALLGTKETIEPLLEAFHNDSSADLRERAACNLADSGMLSRELRKSAVPEVVRFSEDPNLDATTRQWVFQALREITEQNLPNDSAAWVHWYGAHAGSR